MEENSISSNNLFRLFPFINREQVIEQDEEFIPATTVFRTIMRPTNSITNFDIEGAFQREQELRGIFGSDVSSPREGLENYKLIKEFCKDYKEYISRNDFILNSIKERENDKTKLEDSINNVKINLTLIGMTATQISDVENEMIKSCQAKISALELDKLYAERSLLKKYYETAVPLLSIVYKEFFKDDGTIIKNPCSICYENPISYTCDPCGHTVCDKCALKLGRDCFQCRTRIRKTFKIFI